MRAENKTVGGNEQMVGCIDWQILMLCPLYESAETGTEAGRGQRGLYLVRAHIQPSVNLHTWP